MINLFDSDNYPDSEPTELVAGSRWGWTRSDITAAYPTASYTLLYRFSLQSGLFGVWDITATKTGDVHIVDEAQAGTAGFTAGDYLWKAVIVRDSDSEEVVVEQGMVKISADLSSAGDSRSYAAKVLDAIQATILGTASKDQGAYAIGGRSLSLRPITELMELEKDFIKRVQSEKNAINRKAGRTVNSRVLVKMSA